MNKNINFKCSFNASLRYKFIIIDKLADAPKINGNIRVGIIHSFSCSF